MKHKTLKEHCKYHKYFFHLDGPQRSTWKPRSCQ